MISALLVLAAAPVRFAPVRFVAAEATQGVAIDRRHAYAVSNHAIGKYERASGRRVGGWEGPADGPIKHLDSGVIVGGRLVCAHSNFPEIPMQSSIEFWDPRTMRHVKSVPLGLTDGSATWVDRHDGSWWVAFAHYAGKGGVPGRGPEHTRLVRYDDRWRPMAEYAYPKSLVARWDGMSNSGGFFLPDGRLLLTPHHAPEVYVVRLPTMGSELVHERTVPVECEGQGVSRDPLDPAAVWGIQRETREIVRMPLPR